MTILDSQANKKVDFFVLKKENKFDEILKTAEILIDKLEATDFLEDDYRDSITYDESEFLYYTLIYLAKKNDRKGIYIIEKLLTVDIDVIEEYLGLDFSDLLLPSIISEIFLNDIDKLKRIIQDPKVDTFWKSHFFDALIVLVGTGKYFREDFVLFLKELLNLESIDSIDPEMASDIVFAACQIHPKELMEEITYIYENEIIDEPFYELHEIEELSKKNILKLMSTLKQMVQEDASYFDGISLDERPKKRFKEDLDEDDFDDFDSDSDENYLYDDEDDFDEDEDEDNEHGEDIEDFGQSNSLNSKIINLDGKFDINKDSV